MIIIYVSIKGQVMANGQKMNDLTNQNAGWYSILKNNTKDHWPSQQESNIKVLAKPEPHHEIPAVQMRQVKTHTHVILGDAEFR